mgnify:CR=1 FL=1
METEREIKSIKANLAKNVKIIEGENIKLLAEARAKQKATKIMAEAEAYS